MWGLSGHEGCGEVGIYLGCEVFIKEGYQFKVDEGECVVEADWASAS